MEFRVLGPVQIKAGNQIMALGGAQRRVLLAVLLLDANRMVPAERLTALLWGSSKTARAGLQVRVSQLRRLLLDAGDGGVGPVGKDRLVFRPPGYLLRVAPEELDLQQFAQTADQGRQALAAGDASRAAELLRRALGLWRGQALEDVPAPLLEGRRLALEQCRLAAVEERVEADLRLGRHAALVGELGGLVGEQAFRERLLGQLMVALYRCGRHTEALAAYRQARQKLVHEQGLEPGRELQRLEQAILTADPSLEIPGSAGAGACRPAVITPRQAGGAVVPAQLPAVVAGFTGRRGALSRLDAHLSERAARGPASVVYAIVGTAGVGKTALAVQWAHQIRGQFRDGQLYVDLRGYAPSSPTRPLHALARLLRGLGVEAERIPVDVDEAAALYRSQLSGRHVLVMLDNARSAEQVRPLLPGAPGCLALVTSRDRLTGLIATHGARRLILDGLSPDEAVALLERVVGRERVRTEHAAAAELAAVCGLLPLALRIAAANLAGRSDLSIAHYVAELRDGDRLAGLQVENDRPAAVQVAFDCSYAALGPEARRLFRLLGLMPFPEFTLEVAAALAAVSPEQARQLLDQLLGAHLLERRRPGRYALPVLLRLYAGAPVCGQDGEQPRQQTAPGRHPADEESLGHPGTASSPGAACRPASLYRD